MRPAHGIHKTDAQDYGPQYRREASARKCILMAVVAVLGMTGCSTAPTTAGVRPSVRPSASASAMPSPTATQLRSPTATTPPSLSFVPTGSMHVARDAATATLLQNGKVLVAGGADFSGSPSVDYYASAELYDPATGEFATTGSMIAARAYATATLLQNGKVLIAGGEGCADGRHCTNVARGTALASAELYDPGTGKFTETGSMTGVSDDDTATILSDGRVLMAGFGDWADLYEPDSAKFIRTGREAALNYPILATPLPNGKVLVAGQAGPSTATTTLAQVYDETSGTFTTVSLALPSGTPSVTFKGQVVHRPEPSSLTLLKDGRVLLFAGGYLETYDPATGVCADAGFISPVGEWDDPTAILLSDGSVLFEGGGLPYSANGPNGNITTAVVYDPAGGSLRTGSAMLPRNQQTTTLLADGRVLIAGGEDNDSSALASAELFKP